MKQYRYIQYNDKNTGLPKTELKVEVLATTPEERAKQETRRQKQIARIREELKNQELQAQWMRDCAKKPKPIVGPPAGQLDLSLASLIAYAKKLHKEEGNQDAAATLRVLGPIAVRR